jgi:hypothetical protein
MTNVRREVEYVKGKLEISETIRGVVKEFKHVGQTIEISES